MTTTSPVRHPMGPLLHHHPSCCWPVPRPRRGEPLQGGVPQRYTCRGKIWKWPRQLRAGHTGRAGGSGMQGERLGCENL